MVKLLVSDGNTFNYITISLKVVVVVVVVVAVVVVVVSNT